MSETAKNLKKTSFLAVVEAARTRKGAFPNVMTNPEGYVVGQREAELMAGIPYREWTDTKPYSSH
jgi:hypothetical protein